LWRIAWKYDLGWRLAKRGRRREGGQAAEAGGLSALEVGKHGSPARREGKRQRERFGQSARSVLLCDKNVIAECPLSTAIESLRVAALLIYRV